MIASPPRPAHVVGGGTRGLIGRLLAVALTALAFATLVCGPAMADQMPPAEMARGHAAPQASMVGAGTGMTGRPDCEECVREDGRAHCGSLPEGVRDAPPHSGPCAAPADGQTAMAAAPVQGATVAVRDREAPRPPDLHQLQVLRV